MAEEPKCPNCGKEVDTGNKFQDHYDDGANEWVECDGCGKIFKLTQHYAPYYVVNACGWDEAYECGNVECPNNSKALGFKSDPPNCVHYSSRLPCNKYKPTEKMISDYEKEFSKKYVPPEE
jgi:hypothetical protein